MNVKATALAALLMTTPVIAPIGKSPRAREPVRIEIKDLAFSPAAFSAHVGDTVEWRNSDFVAHTATARNGDWDLTIPANASRTLVLKRPGTIAFYCRFHPNMTGTVQVSQ